MNALNDGQTLTDAFTYQISDGHGGTSSAALTVTIQGTTDTPANTPPTAVADSASIKEDTAPNPVVGNVLTNDQDADGDTLSVTNAGTFNLAHGSLALKADGSYAYTLDNTNPAVNALNDGQTLTDAFTYQISDGHGGTSSAALTVTIQGTTDTGLFSPETAGTIAYTAEYGAAPTETELGVLVQFTTAQYAYGQHIGVMDPTVYAFESLGVALASTAQKFQNTFGPSNPKFPASTAGDEQFAIDAYASVFGHSGNQDQIQHFVEQLYYFENLYKSAGVFGSAQNIDLLARGAIYGQMLGIEHEINPTTITGIGDNTSNVYTI